MIEKWKVWILIVIMCFLLGWDLGLEIANKSISASNKKYEAYIEQLEMNIDRNTILKIKRRLNQ